MLLGTQPLDEIRGIKSQHALLAGEDYADFKTEAAGSFTSRQSFNSTAMAVKPGWGITKVIQDGVPGSSPQVSGEGTDGRTHGSTQTEDDPGLILE